MKKLIIIAVSLMLVIGIVLGGTALAAKPENPPPVGTPVMMETFSGNITRVTSVNGTYIFNESLSLDFDEVRHVNLTVELWETANITKTYVTVHVGGHTSLWINDLPLRDIEVREIDTDSLHIFFAEAPSANQSGLLYYNITTTYPVAD